MPSRNGQPSRPESTAGRGAVYLRSQELWPASQSPPLASDNPSPADENPSPADESPSPAGGYGQLASVNPPAASDDRRTVSGNPPGRPGPAGLAVEPAAGRPKLPKRHIPPNRPRPPEPPGSPPPIPGKLPKRTADASRPSVPTRLPGRATPANGAGPAGPADPASPPGALPPELFRPLWWRERPGPESPSPRPPQGPAPDQPGAERPGTERPSADQPSAEKPGTDQPGTDQSSAEKPGTDQPSAGEPGTDQAGAGEPSAREPGAPGPPPGQRPPEPSWAAVLATTVRLWTQRRLRWARRLWPARAGWRIVIVAAVVAAIFVAGAATVALSRSGRDQQAAGATGALAAAAAARQQAAAWVASQANPDAIVACDPAMCAALQARGVPAGRLLVLTPGRADPLGSDLVVATPAVRSQFGARLAGVYAPVTLAAFGSGTAQIAIRAVAADGAAAYRAGLAADIRARRATGALMLHNSHIHVAAAARAALADGEVDPRLLATLGTLAHFHPLNIVGFGSPSPGASPGVPLRSAEITGAAPPGSGPASLHSLMTVLQAQRPPYLPSVLEIVQIPPSGAVLRIGFPVPSPLGLLGSGG